MPTPDEIRQEKGELARRISALRDEIATATKELRRLIINCPHHVVCNECGQQAITKECKKDRLFGHGSGWCPICDSTDFGWYCHKSPDHTCHYFTHVLNGKLVVTLITGEDVEPPLEADHDPKYETDDSCLYCGQPEERK